MEGWICLQRKFLEWEWFDDAVMVKLFIYLLLKAYFEPRKWRGIEIGRGQIITGRHQLSAETHLSEQQIRTGLRKLESTGEITLQSTNKFTIITISNYAKYQDIDIDKQPTTQPSNNQQSTNNQPHNNNINNITNKQGSISNADESAKQKPSKTTFNAELFLANEPEQTKELLLRWISYKKKQFGKAYKSEDSFKTFVKKLNQLSGGNFETAKAIIEQSIANCYQGIFELKKSTKNGTNWSNLEELREQSRRIAQFGIALADRKL